MRRSIGSGSTRLRSYGSIRNRSGGYVWLTPDQVDTLLGELPDHLAELVRFSLATGLRQGNVIDLEWSQIDMQRKVAWIHADQVKGRRPIHVTLNATAVEVLRRQIGKHQSRVFTYKGKPIAQVNTKAWKKALKRAGIENFRWHDLRHTWASWLVQHGVPSKVLQEMGGLGVARDGKAVCAPRSGAVQGARQGRR